jgi:hypothetical protein
MDYFTNLPEAYALLNQGASSVAKAVVTNSFCRFGYLVFYRKFYSALERAKHVPHPYTHSRMVWWNATLRRWKSTYERSRRRIRGIETRDYLSFS